jgi:hypothetical protein
VKGEVVDIACATSKGAGGRAAPRRVRHVVRQRGQPVGIPNDEAIHEVTGDFAANNNAKLLDFVAKSVTVTGEVTEQGGKKLLNIKTIKAN